MIACRILLFFCLLMSKSAASLIVAGDRQVLPAERFACLLVIVRQSESQQGSAVPSTERSAPIVDRHFELWIVDPASSVSPRLVDVSRTDAALPLVLGRLDADRLLAIKNGEVGGLSLSHGRFASLIPALPASALVEYSPPSLYFVSNASGASPDPTLFARDLGSDSGAQVLYASRQSLNHLATASGGFWFRLGADSIVCIDRTGVVLHSYQVRGVKAQHAMRAVLSPDERLIAIETPGPAFKRYSWTLQIVSVADGEVLYCGDHSYEGYTVRDGGSVSDFGSYIRPYQLGIEWRTPTILTVFPPRADEVFLDFADSSRPFSNVPIANWIHNGQGGGEHALSQSNVERWFVTTGDGLFLRSSGCRAVSQARGFGECVSPSGRFAFGVSATDQSTDDVGWRLVDGQTEEVTFFGSMNVHRFYWVEAAD